jgi:hypothetical protein
LTTPAAGSDEFEGFELLATPKIHEGFFDHQAWFNSQLIGPEFDYRLPGGTPEKVRVEEVFLGPRFGMGYRLRTAAGAVFEIEKFD